MKHLCKYVYTEVSFYASHSQNTHTQKKGAHKKTINQQNSLIDACCSSNENVKHCVYICVC